MNYKLNNGVAKAAPNKEEILQYAIQHGILDLPDIEAQIEMSIRAKYLEQHKHKIWQGNDGRWCTYIPDSSHPKGIKFCKRKNKEDLEDAIIEAMKQMEENPTVE